MSSVLNIKDKNTQKNVIDTLRIIQQKLKTESKSNLAIFAGSYV